MATELFFVRVYRPRQMFEYEIEVDPDLIGLDDEGEVNATPEREALRQAIRRAREGDGECTSLMDEEFVALMWSEADRLTTYGLLEGSPFDRIAADRVAAVIDLMTLDGRLDARSALADARLDYGRPFSREEAEAVLKLEVEHEPGQREATRNRPDVGRDGEDPTAAGAGGDRRPGPEARPGEPGPAGAGQRTPTGNRRSRRVAPVQRRRRSRPGKGVDG